MPKSSTRRPPSILDSILAEAPAGAVTDEELVHGIESNFTPIPGGYLIPIERVEPWERQPRRTFDEDQIAMLADSIADAGLLEPLIVRRAPLRPGHYIIIAGHRRLLACRRLHGSGNPARREKVAILPSIVREVAEDTAFADALVENLVRTDLTRKETLDAVAQLQREYGWSGHQIANRTGRNPSDINTLLRISRHPTFYRLVSEERINPSVAGILMRLSERGQESVIERLAGNGQWVVTADDARRFVDNERSGHSALDDGFPADSLTWVNSPTRTVHDSPAYSGRPSNGPPSVASAPEYSSAPAGAAVESHPNSTQQMPTHGEGVRTREGALEASRAAAEADTLSRGGELALEAPASERGAAQALPVPGGPGERVHVSTHTRRKPGADHASASQTRRSDKDVEDFAHYILAWAQESTPLTPGQRQLVADALEQLRQTLGLPSLAQARQ